MTENGVGAFASTLFFAYDPEKTSRIIEYDRERISAETQLWMECVRRDRRESDHIGTTG